MNVILVANMVELIGMMKMFTYLLLFKQQFQALMESSTGFTGEVTGFFGFQ